MIREATASTLLVCYGGAELLIGLTWHTRLGGWLPAGGHVEQGESPGETAVREAWEEAGVRARLMSLPLPEGFPHQPVATAWWMVEMPACADNHTPVEHVHVDHVFVAEVDAVYPVGGAECQVRWFTADELACDPDVGDDVRSQALQVLTWLRQPQRLVGV
jgi:8-oxo-dGTP pyrophosphatase MutT (NUDIX family)